MLFPELSLIPTGRFHILNTNRVTILYDGIRRTLDLVLAVIGRRNLFGLHLLQDLFLCVLLLDSHEEPEGLVMSCLTLAERFGVFRS